MKNKALIVVSSWLITLPAFAHSADFFKVLKKSEVKHITEPSEFQTALQSLLTKNWALAYGRLKIQYKADPKAEPRPDFSEVEFKTINNPADLHADELGICPDESNGCVYGGPFVIGKGDQKFAFILTVDDRTWGYDRDQYFVIYKKWSELKLDTPHLVASLPYSVASTIKKNASYPLPLGFQAPSDSGKKLLTELSNRQWLREVTHHWEEELYDFQDGHWVKVKKPQASYYSNSFKFEFWNDFKNINYKMILKEPMSLHTLGPYTNVPDVFALGEKEVAPGVHQFAILAGNRWAMYQGSNRADYLWTNEEFFNATDINQADHLYSQKFAFSICHKGHDCSKMYKQVLERRAGNDMEAGLMILEWNEAHPDEIKMILHMTHQSFEGHTSTFFAK